MQTYQSALQLSLDQAHCLPSKIVPIMEALGLILAEDIVASDAVPSFANSAMDGFAFRSADCMLASNNNPSKIRVIGEIQAGKTETSSISPGNAYHIMTGAIMPMGADIVVPIEEVSVKDGFIEIFKYFQPGSNVRLAGEDISVGGIAVSRGTILRPSEIGVLASIGCVEVPVYSRPTVAVMTTGNEVIDAASRPKLGQIRDANIYSLCAQVKDVGANVMPFAQVVDEPSIIKNELKKALMQADVVLINGGISVGNFDYTKDVLKLIGAKQIFWRVAQKPGSPLGLWTINNKLIFGIPGNPVAAMLMFEEYVRPVLRRMMGSNFLHRPERIGIMDTDWCKHESNQRLNFLRVKAEYREQRLHVTPTGPQGSGLLSSMMHANALALIPPTVSIVSAGSEVLLHLINEKEDH